MSVAIDEFGALVQMSPRELRVAPPFSDLFPIKQAQLDAITASMREGGYDLSRPINVWRETLLVVDGHTRRAAAIAAGIREVPVCFHDFTDEDAAMVYAIKAQVERRQLTDAEVYRVTVELDRRKPRGGDRKSEAARSICPREQIDCDSAVATASTIGASRAKVVAVRTIEDNAEKYPDIKEAVLSGEKSIRMGAREISDRKRKEKPAYEPVVPPPVAVEVTSDVSASSAATVDDEERAWLESHAIRSQVVTRRFDDDALIVRMFAERLGEIKAEALRVIGWRADQHASTLFKAFMRLADIPPIRTWTVCGKCGGSGMGCRACGGGGYVIPGFERK